MICLSEYNGISSNNQNVSEDGYIIDYAGKSITMVVDTYDYG